MKIGNESKQCIHNRAFAKIISRTAKVVIVVSQKCKKGDKKTTWKAEHGHYHLYTENVKVELQM